MPQNTPGQILKPLADWLDTRTQGYDSDHSLYTTDADALRPFLWRRRLNCPLKSDSRNVLSSCNATELVA